MVKLFRQREIVENVIELLVLFNIMKERAIEFVNWLMKNCELAKDNSLWDYNGEYYSVEKLYRIYLSRLINANVKQLKQGGVK